MPAIQGEHYQFHVMLQRAQGSDVKKSSLSDATAYGVAVELSVKCRELRMSVGGYLESTNSASIVSLYRSQKQVPRSPTAVPVCVTMGMGAVTDTLGLITAQGTNGHKTDAQPIVLLLT